jgi:hypothetical protein
VLVGRKPHEVGRHEEHAQLRLGGQGVDRADRLGLRPIQFSVGLAARAVDDEEHSTGLEIVSEVLESGGAVRAVRAVEGVIRRILVARGKRLWRRAALAEKKLKDIHGVRELEPAVVIGVGSVEAADRFFFSEIQVAHDLNGVRNGELARAIRVATLKLRRTTGPRTPRRRLHHAKHAHDEE